MANRRKASPSGARSISSEDAAQLGAIAQALPSGWLVLVEHNGQVAISPGSLVQRSPMGYLVVDCARRVVTRGYVHPAPRI